MKPSVLWWGRCDRDYSRNRTVAKLFVDLGWKVTYFHPVASWGGMVEAYWHRLVRPELIWVPCFRQRDIFSASVWARKWRVPLVIDPLISAFEKSVYEKNKWSPGSRPAEKKRLDEAGLFAKADRVVADTIAHAAFFGKQLRVPAERLHVLFVGADADMFRPLPVETAPPPFEILFFGSFIKLQGVDTIAAAIQKTQDLPATWVLLGEGEMKTAAAGSLHGCKNVRFEPWISYERLPERIARAHILLGIFGTTRKADLVIPNKMFQSMAMGRPVITRRSDAYPEAVQKSDAIGWVPPGDGDALAEVVRQWVGHPATLGKRGMEMRRIFEHCFGENTLRKQLSGILEGL